MEVDARRILHMTLETTAHTAPEATISRRIQAIGTRLQWGKIADHRALRVLLTEDMIVERTLVVISYLARWIPREEMVGKFQKVEGATVLAIIPRKVLALCRRLEEMPLSDNSPVTKAWSFTKVQKRSSAALRLSLAPKIS